MFMCCLRMLNCFYNEEKEDIIETERTSFASEHLAYCASISSGVSEILQLQDLDLDLDVETSNSDSCHGQYSLKEWNLA